MRDATAELEELGVEVYGISTDDVVSQAKFVEQQELEFLLLSDPDAGVTAKYGVLMRGRPYASRVTFVIDDKGVIRHVDQMVSVGTHGADLVEVVKGLKGS